MLRRRRLLCTVAAVAALAACGEPPAATGRPRVGFLGEVDESFEAFRAGLRDLGCSDGQNILVLPRPPVSDDLDQTVRALVAMPVDVIVAGNNAWAFAAKRATSTIPIVMARAQDSVEVGLVASLARPGGNLTGIAVPYAGLTVKRLDLLHEAFPNVRKPILGYSGGSARPADAYAADRTIEAGRRLGMDVLAVSAGTSDEWLAKLSDAAARGGDGLVLMHMIHVVLANACRRFAAQRGLPSIWASALEADNGGLMAYAFDQPRAFRRAATFVDRILKGAKPADLPLEQPTTYDFVINLAAARSLGLTIPDAVLARATRIIR